jgi:hypothetical protein
MNGGWRCACFLVAIKQLREGGFGPPRQQPDAATVGRPKKALDAGRSRPSAGSAMPSRPDTDRTAELDPGKTL